MLLKAPNLLFNINNRTALISFAIAINRILLEHCGTKLPVSYDFSGYPLVSFPLWFDLSSYDLMLLVFYWKQYLFTQNEALACISQCISLEQAALWSTIRDNYLSFWLSTRQIMLLHPLKHPLGDFQASKETRAIEGERDNVKKKLHLPTNKTSSRTFPRGLRGWGIGLSGCC